MSVKAQEVKVGEVYHRWTVAAVPVREGRYLMVPVVCTCGTRSKIEQTNLRKGLSKSCGCLKKELAGLQSRTHGKRSAPIYAMWNMMRQRCNLTTNPAYSSYGGRGIKVCERWQKFEAFYEDMGDPPEGCSLDRIDTNADYAPGNVRWASKLEQANNTRKSIRFQVHGEELTLREAAEKYNINKSTLSTRVYTYGYTLEEAVDTPVLTPAESARAVKTSRQAGRVDGHLLYTDDTAQKLQELTDQTNQETANV